MDKIQNKNMYRYLMVLTICATAGLHVWRTLFDNFAVHVIDLNGSHIGILQSVREIPGFLALLVVYVLFIIKEHRLSALSVLILGIGVAGTGFFPSFYGLLFTTLIMSFGFHYFETTNQSLTLQYFDEKTSPVVFGKLRSLASASNVCSGAMIFILASVMNYTQLYLMFGILIVGAAAWALTRNPTDKNIIPQRKKMILRKKYWLFYFLTFMAGARRQIFVAFAVFLLVKKFGFSVQDIAVLFLVNNIINYFLSPFIGRCIVRFGERNVLSLEYFSLIIIFISYAMVESKTVVACLYVADHIFFNFAIAIRTFFQKIADPRDIAPSMAVGFTINHIAAVFLPAVGGLLWLVDYRIPFVGGAIFSFFSLLLVQQIPGQLKKPRETI
ncbi:MAG: MFS transporter [Desulfobacteraceae bacterium]|nr:MFS transporter [Desulfobacteraceae bacterium]